MARQKPMRLPPPFIVLVPLALFVGTHVHATETPPAPSPAATSKGEGEGEAPDEADAEPAVAADPNVNPLPFDDAIDDATDDATDDANLKAAEGEAIAPNSDGESTTSPAPPTSGAKNAPTTKLKTKRQKPFVFVGISAATAAPSLLPIPVGVEWDVGGFVSLRLFDLDVTDDFGVFIRGQAAGSYGEGTSHYRATMMPFSDHGGLAVIGEHYQLGPDVSFGMRLYDVEAAIDLGVRGGNDVGVARFVGGRASVEVRYVLDMGIALGVVYSVQHAISLGDIAPGWTSSKSGVGLRVTYGI